MSRDSWKYMYMYRQYILYIANIYSLYNFTFNLAIKTVNVGLCNTLVLHLQYSTPTSHLFIVSPAYVYADYFYINTFTKITLMHIMQCNTLRQRLTQKLGYV